MPRKKMPLNTQQELFVRMTARAESRKDIMKAVFDIDLDTAPENVIHAADAKMTRWRKHKDFDAVWKDEVRSVLVACTSEAIQKIRGQMRDAEQPWLQNKAANDILNYGKAQIFGDEERAVHVKIDGMPDLGSPDDSE